MKINTYGHNMFGLWKAASRTHDLNGSELYIQISYDRSDGEVLTNLHLKGSWSQYDSNAIIHVCNASYPMTQQQIADAIDEAIRAYEFLG